MHSNREELLNKSPEDNLVGKHLDSDGHTISDMIIIVMVGPKTMLQVKWKQMDRTLEDRQTKPLSIGEGNM